MSATGVVMYVPMKGQSRDRRCHILTSLLFCHQLDSPPLSFSVTPYISLDLFCLPFLSFLCDYFMLSVFSAFLPYLVLLFIIKCVFLKKKKRILECWFSTHFGSADNNTQRWRCFYAQQRTESPFIHWLNL